MFTLPSSKHSTQPKAEGYIIIVVLLLAAVLLMLALSFAARTTEQVFLSSQEEDTTRVFNAAESGIEQALYQLDTRESVADGTAIVDLDADVDSLSDIQVIATNISDADITVRQGETLTVVPPNQPNRKTLDTIKWKNPCVGMLVTLYRASTNEARHASFFSAAPSCSSHTLEFDPSDPGAGFTLSAGGDYALVLNIGTHFGYTAATDYFSPNDMVRITPLFADIAFDDVQATELISTATDNRSGGSSAEVRKIEVIRTQPGPPSVFDYAVFSGGDLVKNN